MSLLSTFGADFKKIFTWIGSPKGQATVTTIETAGEAIADAVDPALSGLNSIISSWTEEIFKSEALAAAAGVQNGTGAQKTAAVLSAVTPQVIAFAQANKLPAPTATDLNTINTALVSVLNTLGTPTATTTPAA